ncbi:hypothetical protein QTN25_008618 [Entamoeba marina]
MLKKEVMQLKIQLCKESLQYEVESHQKKKDECLNKLNELQKDIDKIRTDYQKQKKDQDSLLSGERIAHLHTEIGNLKKDNHIFDIEIDVLKSKISVYDARLSQTKKDVCYIVYVTNN